MTKEDVPNGGDAPPPPPPEVPAELPPPTPEEVVTPEIVDKLITGYNPDCSLVDFSAKLGTKIGDNYMSIMYSVSLNLLNRKTSEPVKLDVMLKTMPRNPMRQQMINDSGAFIKDANIYDQVLPRMITFQEEKGLGVGDIVAAWPKCYVTFNDGTADYLGMEDLKVKGFKMANRLAGLDFGHASLVLQNIARFHALSFAMFGGSRDKIMSTYPWLEEKMFPAPDKVQEPMKMWMKSMFAQEADIVRKEGYPEEAALVEDLINDDFWVIMNQLMNGGEGHFSDSVVINHGDCWTNNMMFHYGDGDKTPKDLKFVDFQLARCAPRSVDLNYFLHSSIPIVDLNTREEEYLRIYHEEFIRFVGKLGVVPEEFGNLSWDSFREEYDQCKYYGVVMGLMLAPILSADSADVPDMETMKEEDWTGDGATDFMKQLMGTKSDSTKKILNLAVNHLPKCVQMAKK